MDGGGFCVHAELYGVDVLDPSEHSVEDYELHSRRIDYRGQVDKVEHTALPSFIIWLR